MKLGLQEIITTVGITLAACNPQEPPESGVTDSVIATTHNSIEKNFPAKTGKPIPTEADLRKNQLTEDCTPADQPLVGEQFPMKRGTELISTLQDGTCLENFEDDPYDDSVLYAINGNRKIKFSNLTAAQKKRVLKATSFADLQELSITFMEETEHKANHLIGMTANEQSSAITLEAPITACPKYRYRRAMSSGTITSTGMECIWDERQVYCPTVITSTDSTFKEWEAPLVHGEYVLFNPKREPQYLDAVTRPTPQQWLGTQPECPGVNSVVNIDLSHLNDEMVGTRKQ